MSFQKLAIAAVVVVVVSFILDYLFYGIIMSDFFSDDGTMLEMPRFGWLITGYFFFAFPFVYFYERAHSAGSKVSSGAKYGVIVALMVGVYINLTKYALDNTPHMNEVIVDAIYTIVLYAILGIIVAYLTGLPDDRGPGKGTSGGAVPPPPSGGGES
jgi:hypothetical protein